LQDCSELGSFVITLISYGFSAQRNWHVLLLYCALDYYKIWWFHRTYGFFMLNALLSSISIIYWWSVLLLEESGLLRENNRLVAS